MRQRDMLDEKSQREITKIAHELWEKDGRPEGRDREHWEAAKELWAFRSHNHVLPDEAEQAGGGRLQQAADSGPKKRASPGAGKSSRQGQR
ncbi:DUF2934 domain-containing protein [Bosea thiooxidans]